MRYVCAGPPGDGADVPEVFLPGHADASPDGSGLFVAVDAASGPSEPPTDDLAGEPPRAEVTEVEIVVGAELRKALDEGAEHAGPTAEAFGKSLPSGHAPTSTVGYGTLLLAFMPLVPG